MPARHPVAMRVRLGIPAALLALALLARPAPAPAAVAGGDVGALGSALAAHAQAMAATGGAAAVQAWGGAAAEASPAPVAAAIIHAATAAAAPTHAPVPVAPSRPPPPTPRAAARHRVGPAVAGRVPTSSGGAGPAAVRRLLPRALSAAARHAALDSRGVSFPAGGELRLATAASTIAVPPAGDQTGLDRRVVGPAPGGALLGRALAAAATVAGGNARGPASPRRQGPSARLASASRVSAMDRGRGWGGTAPAAVALPPPNAGGTVSARARGHPRRASVPTAHLRRPARPQARPRPDPSLPGPARPLTSPPSASASSGGGASSGSSVGHVAALLVAAALLTPPRRRMRPAKRRVAPPPRSSRLERPG